MHRITEIWGFPPYRCLLCIKDTVLDLDGIFPLDVASYPQSSVELFRVTAQSVSADRLCWQQVTANSLLFCPEQWGYGTLRPKSWGTGTPRIPRKLCLCGWVKICGSTLTPTIQIYCSEQQNVHWSPVSIQTQSLALRALRALRKRKPQETQSLASVSYTHLTLPTIYSV